MARTYDVVVIGAGLNGLTAACHLAKAGRSVLVLEQRAQAGGSAITEDLAPGFRYDPCTSDPGWISPVLLRELDLARHGLELLPAEDTLAGLGASGPPLVLHRDLQRSVASIEKLSRGDARQWPALAQRLHKLAGFLGLMYDAPPPQLIGGGMGELMSLAKLGHKLRSLGKKDMIELLRVLPMSIAELLDDELESDILKATIGAGGVSGIFQGPRSAGTAFALLHHHVGGDLGAFRMRQRVRGGSGSLAAALSSAARAAGAEIRLGVGVTSLRIAGDTVIGVVAGDDVIDCRAVLSSTDVRTTLLDLVSPAHLDPELVRAIQNVRARGVVARVHLALSALPQFRELPGDALRGVISIAAHLDDIERAYDDAKHGGISASPMLEITIPSLADPSVAPAGQHVMSISMQYAPFRLKHGTWDAAAREKLGTDVVRTIEQHAPGLSASILHKQVLTPTDLAMLYHQPEGNIEHAELGLDQILFMRPLAGFARHESPVRGLYLGGAGCHPGRTIAGGAGRLAARALLNPA
jgi:phytoene dehydrogenase-like protein